ncbi:MAG: M1 family metallopeptidase, partial [Chitinophagaceae bacterium]
LLRPGEEKTVTLVYHGIPADGLIISNNEFGHRTFFADNWPERAHYWIPCNDHLSDKASVDFLLTVPDHYQVVGNGVLVEEFNLPKGMRLWHWKEEMVLPTKVMAIGVADFAVQLDTVIDHVPVQSWVFSQNRDSGFAQYAVSKYILPFYIHYIGPYPYQKLANVQSKTRFGGMEDASNIFYNENSVSLHPKNPAEYRFLTEALMAHETAHQWFGDEVSETDWQHLWLSEGFATYMTDLYIEHRYGEDSLKARLAHDRQIVINFYRKRKTPVVDTAAKNDPMKLLNPNTYEKGSWVLHMLRRKLGDRLFQKGIRTYYAEYKGRNASTNDLKVVMEKISHQNLDGFFRQWLYTPGQPELHCFWHYNDQRKSLSITIEQMQYPLFQFPVQVGIKNGKQYILRTLHIHNKHTTVTIPLKSIPQEVILDPNVNLLFDGKIVEE